MQQPGGVVPALRTVGAVVEAGQAQQLVSPALIVVRLAPDRLGVRRAGELVDQLHVLAQPRPAGEAVVAGQGELGVGKLEGGGLGCAPLQVGEPGVVLTHQGDWFGEAGSHQVTQRLGVGLELLDVRVVG